MTQRKSPTAVLHYLLSAALLPALEGLPLTE